MSGVGHPEHVRAILTQALASRISTLNKKRSTQSKATPTPKKRVKLAGELKVHGVLVNSVDPGLTATAPGMEEMGARPIPDGAASVVRAAMLAKDGPTGSFFRDGKPLPW